MIVHPRQTADAVSPAPSIPRSPRTAGSVVGIVVIGRNEGERLPRCLDAARACGLPIIYVDSGSEDLSVPWAMEKGIEVVQLDDSRPFTAARARNAGFERLTASHGGLQFVQFVDGDCELCDGWFERAATLLKHRPDVAVVCGRVRERFPDASIYNRICDMEWKQPVGEIDGCGGNMMVRVAAFRQVGGFNPDIIAAEDSELCARLKLNGGKIFSIEADMVCHDAAMLRLAQWWRRAVRAGHAMTEGAVRHGRSPARLFARASGRIFLYGTLLPLLVLLGLWPTQGWSLLLLAVYPLQYFKTAADLRRRGEPFRDAALYAAHCVLAKFPQAIGQGLYGWNRLRGKRTRIIEHKQADGQFAGTHEAATDTAKV